MIDGFEHILVDGRNCTYRSTFAARNSGVHPATVFLRFLSSYLYRFPGKKLHVFWEGHRSKLWRRELLPTYKNRVHEHDFDVEGTVRRVQLAMMQLLLWMNCRQYCRRSQEADDLIYAFCRSQIGERTLIISNDGDFVQIPFLYRHVEVFDPMADRMATPTCDVIERKCFCGDKSDVVPGYYGIKEKKAAKLMADLPLQMRFFQERGDATYILNRKLVDLSCCPAIGENILYVRSVLARPHRGLDEQKVMEMIRRHKVAGLTGELSNRLMPFRSLA